MEINENFVGWIKFLFGNVSVAVKFNGSPCKKFKIERGVRQWCLLAPYIFIIVRKVFTHINKRAEAEGKICGILLLRRRKQQSIIQYANDSAFMIRGDKKFVDEINYLLRFFNDASRIEIY